MVRRRIRNLRGLKLRPHADLLIDLNYYFALFPGDKLGENIVMTELNEILLNSMLKSWRKKAYVQVFDWESIIF